MPARDSRYSQVGVNSGGDRMYARTYASSVSEYEGWTKDELAAELEARGLAKSGTKAELIARLNEDG